MHKRNQKILGYVLAIFMLVLGVCLGNVKTHSLFASSSTEHVISLSGSIDGGLSLEEFCTEEMIGCANLGNILFPSGFKNLREGSGLFFALVCEDLSICKEPYSYIVEVALVFPEKYCETIILNYIHNTDGKKKFFI